MTVTLTTRDLEQFAESGRHALRLFLGQYALIAPKFPTVTDEAVAAMIERVKADPVGTPKAPGIDAAIYFAALFQLGTRNLDAVIKALGQNADATTLHSLFQQTYTCANTTNALTLLGQGGLMPQLHVDEAQSTARQIVASSAAGARHAKTNTAKAWVQSQWKTHGATQYENNKSAFARTYAKLVPQQFPTVTVTEKTIAQVWLTK